MTTSVAPSWSEHTLGELFDFSNGVNAGKVSYGRGVPFANVLEVITNEGLTEALIPGRVSLNSVEQRRYEVSFGDVLFNRTSETPGDVGLASTYIGNARVVFGGFVLRGHPKTSLLDVGYSKYALRSAEVRSQIVSRGQGGIRANIGQRDLASVVVHLPPIDLQRVIANILDDGTELVATLQQVVEKKRAIKQGILQSLMTRRVRLPGFSDPWRQTVLGTLAQVVGGGTPSTSVRSFWGGSIPWFTPAEISRHGSGLVSRSRRRITDAGLRGSSAKLLPPGTILVTSRATIGHAAVTAAPSATNQGFASLIPSDPRSTWFLYYWVQYARQRMEALSSGSTFLEISARKFAAMQLLAPSFEEQASIADVLRDVDAEIATLGRQLESARAVREGMMQALLAGRMHLSEGVLR